MRIFLYENVDRRLEVHFPQEHEVVTVAEVGWTGKKNGEHGLDREYHLDKIVRQNGRLTGL